MDFTKQLQWRYATKFFDKTKKIAPKDWQVLKDSLRLAPSSFGLQPWKFVVVEDKPLRAALRAEAFGQDQVTDAAQFVVIAAKTDLSEQDVQVFTESIAQTHGVDLASLDRYKNMMLQGVHGRTKAERFAWNARQAYIPLGFLMATAAYMEIDTCPMEGFDPEAFDKLLGLEELGLSAVVCVALGYRAAEDKSATKPKVRFSERDVFLMK